MGTARWSRSQQRFLHINEKIAARITHHLIADHPEIKRHLANFKPDSKITTIAYGAPAVFTADRSLLEPYGVLPGCHLSLIARPVAENSILEIVSACLRKPRGINLLVFGKNDKGDPYQSSVLSAARSASPAAVYASSTVKAIRVHILAYLHGHTVGGTNPSLVEAPGCGNPAIAHENTFNRWVAQDAGPRQGRVSAGQEQFDGVVWSSGVMS